MIEVAKGDDTMRMKTVMALAVAALTVTAGAAMGQTRLDPDLAPYQTVSGVSGNVSSVGSDTLNNLMTHWAESFQRFYPTAKVQIEGKGSSTAPPALITGTAQLGPMSREMKGTEVDQFEKKYGYKPTPIRTSVDALAVFVNKDNPIKCLSVPQVDAGKCVEATADNAYSGAYPLARFLYVYVNKAPGKPLDPLTREFVKLIVSKEGQEGVIKDGYFPIPASIAKEELNKVQ